MWPVFADPKTDFVFKRIFGAQPNKHLLIELLNALLELEGEQRIEDLAYLSPEQRVPVAELKLSIVDVKCRDHSGREYVVEMQAKIAKQDACGAISLAERQGEIRGFARGRERGLAEGYIQGLADGLRRGIQAVCELLVIPLDPSRRAEIERMHPDQLDALLARLKRERRWG